MSVLVTGGAGYVGSIVTEALLKNEYKVVILDNLNQGHKEAIPPGAEFARGDICDSKVLDEVFHRFKIDAVMHMAADMVIESITIISKSLLVWDSSPFSVWIMVFSALYIGIMTLITILRAISPIPNPVL